MENIRGANRPCSEQETNFLTVLTECVVRDVAKIVEVDLSRDLLTINKRVASEGVSFLSKTLPNLAKALEKGLETGTFTSPTSFARKRYGRVATALPAFLLGLLNRVFDEKSGDLLQKADPASVWGVRQICYLVYKYQLPFTEEQNSEACSGVVLTDASLPEYAHFKKMTHGRRGLLLWEARKLMLNLFSGFDILDIIPRNGAGASNSPLVNRQSDKYEFVRALPDDTERCYPLRDYFSPSLACGRGQGRNALYLSAAGKASTDLPYFRGSRSRCDRITHIVPVPKDIRGPRIIGKENPELQALQQGQRMALQNLCETHPLTRGHINFSDQGVNARLALQASIDQKMATLDMKDASDRVSVGLVQALFPSDIFEALMATRSTHALVPVNGTKILIRLKKFSPMGSGVCFPVESIVFWALSVAALIVCGVSRADALRNVYVYGDDTIVPTAYATQVIKLLTQMHLRYNKGKCYIAGNFRESCGTDAFKGVVVTPLRLKKRLPTQISDAESIVSWVSIANAFALKNMWATYYHIKHHIEAIPKLGRLPYVRANTGCLGWFVEPAEVDKRWRTERISKKAKRIWAASASGEPCSTHQRWAEVIDRERPFLQGVEILAWCPVHQQYDGTEMGLNELGRYFRFVTERSEDSKTFGERYTLSLRRKRIVLT